MKVTNEMIEAAYAETYIAVNMKRHNVSLNDILEINAHGEKLNSIYEIINNLYKFNSKFGVLLIHADGGIWKFFITHKLFDDYFIVISEEQYSSNGYSGIKSVASLCEYLNGHLAKISRISIPLVGEA